MSCPICGDRCTCPQSGGELHTSILVDPELPETTEEQFEASLNGREERDWRQHEDTSLSPPRPEPWRHEVASRVDAFCARRGRKRGPRLASLSFEFEPPSRTMTAEPLASPMSTSALARQIEPVVEPETSNLIEFPRPVVPLPPPAVQLPILDELAEPVIQVPRILEAEPEDIGLQFGGEPMPSITLEAPPAPPVEEYPEPAPLWHRAVAGGIDATLVLGATAAFGIIFTKLTGSFPTNRAAVATAIAVPAILWAVYEYLFWVYSGATLGMRLTRLELRTFDATPVRRSTRRWRAIAMMVSAMSLGMGFFWAVIDEDGHCWHDRISHTLLRPR